MKATAEHESATPLFSFGIITDAQYADLPSNGTRFYRETPAKLQAAVEELNRHDLEFVMHLGDFIDRDMDSMDRLLPLLHASEAPVHHVLGNHDFLVDESLMESIPGLLGMRHRYYDFATKNWRFVVLDGNGYGAETWPENHPNRLRAEEMLKTLKSKEAENAYPWNGAIDDDQLKWLDVTLSAADRNNEFVLICCHFPVLPPGELNLLNHEAVLETIEKHSCVKGWLNGHEHAGGYTAHNGIHFLTFKGMVETADTNAFATVDVYPAFLRINGFGREPNRMLRLV